MDLTLHEFGDPSGEPLLFCHGWPGSGTQAVLLDVAAKRRGYRVVAPDRPGIGHSIYHAGRRLSDWPEDVRRIARLLGWQHFSVLGISGGGPYALACAHAMPELLRSVAIVSGAPPLADPRDWPLLHLIYRILLNLFHRRPALIRAILSAVKPLIHWQGADSFYRPCRVLLPSCDAAAIASPENFAAVFNCQREAFTNIDGLFTDAAIYAHPWGFDPAAIRIPVDFWHGNDDANFHPDLARSLAALLPCAKLRVLEHEGHFSLPINQADTILAALRNSC